MDQELADAAVYPPGRRCVCFTRRQHFSAWNYIMAAILNVWHCIKNLDSVNRCTVLEEQSCQPT